MRKVTIRVPADAELEVVRGDDDGALEEDGERDGRIVALRGAIDYALLKLRGVLDPTPGINAAIRKLADVVEGPES